MAASGFYYSPDHDINDGNEWSEQDIADLKASLESGDTLEEAAGFLCRAGTVEEVRAKADELRLRYKRGKTGQPRRVGRQGDKSKKKATGEQLMHRWKGRIVPDKVK